MRNNRRAGKPEKQGLTGLFTKGKNIPTTAQQTLPYREMYRDGVCRVADRYYTKTIEYEDINYQLAQSEDQAAIFDGWSACLNYFDSSLPFQLSFLNHRSRPGSRYSVNIPMQDDDYNSVRCEYVEMLENQIAKSNNGIVRTKLLTFGVNVDDLSTARARLERVEADICGNFKKLGVKCRSLSGLERLELLHGQLHPGSGSPFRFSWDMIPKTGLSTKDFIAPDSFDFRFSRLFRVGTTWGAASYLQILASELSDKLLAELLEMDAEMTITLHIQTVDQAAAVKSIKAKVSDIDKMKVEEQKKAARSGYDMDILPPDLVTYSNDAKTLLEDLQSRNERMFLLTFLVVNMADTKRKLENDVFAAAGIAQKYNCALTRLDYQQEAGLMSSIPLGENLIPIQRGLTTSSTAIFIPFITQELFQTGEALYYGLNALSNNMILCDRKQLKNPNGLILGTPGCFTGDTKIRLSDGGELDFATLYARKQSVPLVSYDFVSESLTPSVGCDVRITKYTDRLVKVTLENGACISCTPEHRFLTELSGYVEAQGLKPGTRLVPQHTVKTVEPLELEKPVPVYDVTVEPFGNFMLGCGVIVHNSGKSFAAKREMTNAFLITDDDIIICDPEAEYFSLVQRLNGQVVRLSPAGKGMDGKPQYVNPMDINLNYSEDDNPLALKSDFILSLCELVIGGKEGLQPVDKTVIDRAVRNVYRPFLADPDPAKMPVLGDLYDELLKQPEPEAARIAAALELYVSGSLNVFNHRTNVELSNRLVCFDIKQLGKQLKKLGMLIVQDQVWNRVTVNRAEKKATRYYMDEFHLLLKEEQTAAYSVEIWKRFRKWGGIPTAITQNVKDLLASREVENIFENSDFVLMLNQAQGDRAILARQLNISPQQMKYVTHTEAGEGLIFYGNVVLPFVDRFPKDTELYRVMTTKPEEVGEA